MSALDIRAYWECETFANYSSEFTSASDPATKYTIRYGNLSYATGGKNADATHGWTCNCPSFINDNGPVRGRIGIRECKHIQNGKFRRCGWNEFSDGGEPEVINGEKRCPRCGGPITARNWGV